MDIETSKEIAVPFLKWAGGKRWLTKRFPDLIPRSFRRYYEPFLGSGAVFFHLDPPAASISDSNGELVDTYRAIRDEPENVMRVLRAHSTRHNDDYYYVVRASQPKTPAGIAARFLYLNRTCWNGLYRVNKQGQFNVPRGTKDSVVFPNDNFQLTSRRLKRARLNCCDFELAIDQAEEDDFVFVDPPYTVKHNYNGFLKYNQSIFSWNDQVRLARAIQRATKRGAKILVLNANHESVRELYSGIGVQRTLPRSSILAASSNFRTKTHELAIGINYKVHDDLFD
ncbi:MULTISPECIES: Dam family site-specific DNA-(adenine-N6)-methyltransferase [unclassified Bradyrhizobium]|uniref:DNA adenine methylase n=1 Tax=unclassified Bradyrhizobium TaxID=2631580 RepID=UPI0028EBD21D|nr:MULTISPECIES: Dam family site-specific DNA-(adenine-N6)-methyltransferase [unclassified Bradyrhizobium]